MAFENVLCFITAGCLFLLVNAETHTVSFFNEYVMRNPGCKNMLTLIPSADVALGR